MQPVVAVSADILSPPGFQHVECSIHIHRENRRSADGRIKSGMPCRKVNDRRAASHCLHNIRRRACVAAHKLHIQESVVWWWGDIGTAKLIPFVVQEPADDLPACRTHQ
jgi:hypothetical protein